MVHPLESHGREPQQPLTLHSVLQEYMRGDPYFQQPIDDEKLRDFKVMFRKHTNHPSKPEILINIYTGENLIRDFDDFDGMVKILSEYDTHLQEFGLDVTDVRRTVQSAAAAKASRITEDIKSIDTDEELRELVSQRERVEKLHRHLRKLGLLGKIYDLFTKIKAHKMQSQSLA